MGVLFPGFLLQKGNVLRDCPAGGEYVAYLNSTRSMSKGFLFQQALEASHCSENVWDRDILMLCPSCFLCLEWPLQSSLLKFTSSSKGPFQMLPSLPSFSSFPQMDLHRTLQFFYNSYFILVICILTIARKDYLCGFLYFISSAESRTRLCTVVYQLPNSIIYWVLRSLRMM